MAVCVLGSGACQQGGARAGTNGGAGTGGDGLRTADCAPSVPSGVWTDETHDSLWLDPVRPRRAYGVTSAGALQIVELGQLGSCASPAMTGVPMLVATPGPRGLLYHLSANQLQTSADGGATWTSPVDLMATLRVTAPRLSVDPSRESRVGLAAGASLFVSVDAGLSFARLARPGDGIVTSFVLAAGHTLIVEVRSPPTAPMETVTRFLSVDDGATWSTGDSRPNTIALVDGSVVQTEAEGLSRSTDGGLTWTVLPRPALRQDLLAGAGLTLVVGESRGDTTALALSRDAGAHWTEGLSAPGTTNLGVGQGLQVSADGQEILLETDDGRALSRDGGATWSYVELSQRSAGVGPPGRLSVGAQDRIFARGTNRVYSSMDGGATWAIGGTFADGARGGRLVADPKVAGRAFIGGDGAVGAQTLDGGATWSPWPIVIGARMLGGGETGPPLASNGVWTVGFEALAFDPTTPGTLFAIAYGDVLRSRDDGATWTRLLTGASLATSGRPMGIPAFVGLAVAPSDGRFVYATRVDDLVFYSPDGGDTWASTPLEISGSLAVHPTEASTVVLGTPSGIAVSHDAGATFATVPAGGGFVIVHGFEPWAPRRLVAQVSQSNLYLSGTLTTLSPKDGLMGPLELAFLPGKPGHVVSYSSHFEVTSGL